MDKVQARAELAHAMDVADVLASNPQILALWGGGPSTGLLFTNTSNEVKQANFWKSSKRKIGGQGGRIWRSAKRFSQNRNLILFLLQTEIE